MSYIYWCLWRSRQSHRTKQLVRRFSDKIIICSSRVKQKFISAGLFPSNPFIRREEYCISFILLIGRKMVIYYIYRLVFPTANVSHLIQLLRLLWIIVNNDDSFIGKLKRMKNIKYRHQNCGYNGTIKIE